jgi:eukaryotic-like serine/threonine-protein kinase
MKQCPVCNTDYPDQHHTCPTDGAVLLSASGPEWSPGTTIRGKYRILARLGKGGMGIVYKAQHIFLDELRALKVMWPHLAADPKFRQRFLREGKEGRKLRNNVHIVAIEDQEQAEDGSLYIAMEYVAGVSLRDLIRHLHGPVPIPRALNIARGMAEGLQAAHALGMVHRDIKPDNVLLARDARGWDVAKIADFGIVALRECSTALSSHPLLTAPYAAPEQWQNDPDTPPDPRTDLYAIGITLFEMLTGRLPFRAETPAQWLHAHLSQDPVPPSRFSAELNAYPSMDHLILKLLAKKMHQRPADAQAFLHELDLVESEIASRQFAYQPIMTDTPTSTISPPRIPEAAPPPRLPEPPAARVPATPRAKRPRAVAKPAPAEPAPPAPAPQQLAKSSPPKPVAEEVPRPAPAIAPQLLPPAPSRSGRTAMTVVMSLCFLAVVTGLFLTVWRPLWAPQSVAPEERQRKADIAAHVQKGEDALSKGEYDAAINEFSAVQSLDVDNRRAKDGIEKAQKARATENFVMPADKPSP